MPVINLYDLLFKQILGLAQCTGYGKFQFGCITGGFAHDFIFGLFLPHIVLIGFFYLATKTAFGHRGLELLFALGGYIFIVYVGWYPFFAVLTLWWLILVIGIGAFYFFWGRVIHPSRTSAMFKAGYKAVDKLLESGMSKEEKIKELNRQLERAIQQGNEEKEEQLLRAIKYLKEQG